jgi:hypothetical protein
MNGRTREGLSKANQNKKVIQAIDVVYTLAGRPYWAHPLQPKPRVCPQRGFNRVDFRQEKDA